MDEAAKRLGLDPVEWRVRNFADRDQDAGPRSVCAGCLAPSAGRNLNTLLAKSHYVGGLIGGIGMAIHELTMTDRATGRILGDTLANYLSRCMPTCRSSILP
jgi:CO/xanthine dehydrogenase Mo-binding subunit